MKVAFKSDRSSATKLAAYALATMFLVTGVLAQVRSEPGHEFPNFDHRMRAGLPAGEPEQRAQGQARLKAELPLADVSFDLLLGTPKFIHARNGFLTGPDGQGLAVSSRTAQVLPATDPHRSVKGFLNEHSELFGHGAEVLANAKITRESVGAHNGLRTVVWQQQLDGIPVFDAVLIGNITRRGELASLGSQLLPNPVPSADAGTPNRATLQAQPPVTLEQAIVNAAQNLGDTLAVNELLPNDPDTAGDGYQLFKVGNTLGFGRLVWLPMNRAALRLGWEVFVSKSRSTESFQMFVDAETGEVLLRRSRTSHISDATYNVYTSDSPSPFSPGWPTPNNAQPPLTNRVLVTLSAFDTTASPNGWINDTDNEPQGNNTDVFVDRDFDQQPDGPRPQGNPNRVFDFPLDLTQSPLDYTNASTVQLFYLINHYHDRLYQLGFTESAGNFQNDNFGRGGLGNDRIIAYVQSGADVGFANNAAFGTPPDGFNGRMFQFVFDQPDPDRDSALDADVVFHEATHGTSQRLVGGGVLIDALQTDGMGEGWSDFIALSLLSEPGDDPDAVYTTGGYLTFQFFGLGANYYFGIRHFPYSTDLAKNPFTFKDIDPTQISAHPGVPRSPVYGFNAAEADEVHHQGEVWCATLWDVRANLIHKYGYAGNELMLQLVIDGMKLGPANPNFLQARDAIILADLVNNRGANVGELWAGFAKRGMGFSATSPDSSTTIGVVEAFDAPGLSIQGTIVSGGNGNGVVDLNECNELQVILANFNTFTATGIRVSLSTRTPGIALGVRNSGYLDLPPLNLGTNLVPFTMSTAPFFICGTPIILEALVKTDQETRTNTIILNTGTVGAPVRFDSDLPVAIPDNNPIGTNSPIVVSNITTALREVSVSLFLTHTFDADLYLELIGPDGTVVVLSDRNGGSGNNYGAACSPESLRTTFDDDAIIPIASGFAPFVGSFQPDEALSAFGGKYGTNVNGTWRLRVVDRAGADIGVLHCWSLFLSPAACEDGGGTCPGVDLAIGMTDAPDPVFIGSNLVYSISITNFGPSAATNVVVNQSLPGSVIFVSGSASQGNISFAGGTVVGNLGALPINGVATMTVTVTPTQMGIIGSTATVNSNDPDPDTSNNSATVLTQVQPPSADLAVGLLDAPDPALVDGVLTYTVSVTNYGPSVASGVTVTNTLPLSVAVQSASSSQGTVTINANVVVCHFGTLTNGGYATATINVTPTAPGLIVATATARSNQADSNNGNNTATATTTVGPAVNLVLTLTDMPDPVVVQSNWTYTVTVTNQGPNVANGVQVSHALPAGVNLVSALASQGTVSVAGTVVSVAAGTLPVGSGLIVTVVVNANNAGVYVSSATVSGSEADPVPGNNSASVNTRVAVPFVRIETAGATLTAESLAPADGGIGVGETVTVQLRLRNAGNVINTNLTATLLATGGVTLPSPAGAVNYGVLPTSGLPEGRAFTFTANGANGGTVTATLQLHDNGNPLGTVTYAFTLPTIYTFANTNAITIPDVGSAIPYPSTITVSGVTGLVGKITATLVNLNHTFPQDVDVLLVGPTSENTLLMSGAGSANVSGVNVTFDDGAALPVPQSGSIAGSSYRPAAYSVSANLPPTAPVSPYPATLSVFNGLDANGGWSLYVADRATGDAGNIADGWSLAVSVISPVNQISDLAVSGVATPSLAAQGDNVTSVFTVTNSGPDAATGVAFTNVVPAGNLLLSATSSQGSVTTNGNVVVGSLGSISAGSAATVTVVVRALTAAVLVLPATVIASETDLNPANNAVSVKTTITAPAADLSIGLAAADSVVLGSNLTFTVTVTNHGPQHALDVVVSDPLPAGLNFVSTSAANFSNSGGTILVNVGDLPAGDVAMFAIVGSPASLGTRTNVVSVSTSASDSNPVNNTASAIYTVTAPAPNIVIARAALTAESLSPANFTVDAAETVTVAFALQNVGSAVAANLVATLQASGGVTAPSGAQNYGALVPGGAGVARSFNFTAAGASGVVVATLQLQNGAENLGTVTYNFTLPATASFTNAVSITILSQGAASPYPSTIHVSGLTGLVTKATARLNGLTHAFPDDVDVLLVSPSGQKVVLMSDAGGGHAVTNLTLSFEDGGAALPNANRMVAGPYAPTDFEPGDAFPSPAPAGIPGATLATFHGGSPNGGWSLFVVDDSTGDGGNIAGGWTLTLTTVDPVNPVADLALTLTDAPDPVYTGGGLTYTIGVFNHGPAVATEVSVVNSLPVGVSFVSATPSQGSSTFAGNTVTGSLGTLAVGASASLTIQVTATLGGSLVNTATVAGGQSDLNLINNTAQTATTVVVPIAARLTSVVVTNSQFQFTLTGEPFLNYTIQVSTNLTSWVNIGNVTAAGNGTIQFTDPHPPISSQRFYRAERQIP